MFLDFKGLQDSRYYLHVASQILTPQALLIAMFWYFVRIISIAKVCFKLSMKWL